MNTNEIRSHFPILKRKVHDKNFIYFDSAATTLKPSCVVDEITKHYREEASNVHRGVHFLSEQGTIRFEETREKVKSFINACSTEEIIFTKGTTESLNLVATCFGKKFFNPGDEILLTTMEHHSNIVPWQIIAKETGAIVREIRITDEGDIDLAHYKSLLSSKTKMVSVCHISNTLGTINPIKEMISLAHEVGAKFTVDAAQSIAHTQINVQELDCDFLAFSAHKLFGPTGLGVLYGKKDLLEQLPNYQGGGGMIDQVTIKETTYHDLPNRFEAGTPHIAGVIAFKSAIEFVEKIGFNKIYEIEKELLDHATKRLSEIKDLKIIGTTENKTSVISFTINNVHPQDLGTLLDRQGIAVRTGHHCTQPLMNRFCVNATTRASFSIYNSKEEIDEFINAINKSLDFL